MLTALMSLFAFTTVRLQKQQVKDIQLTDADAEWANKKWTGTTIQDLKSGQEVFNKNCDRCHKLKNPKKFNEEDWQKILPRMGKKAKLEKNQEELVLKFVITAGRSDEIKK